MAFSIAAALAVAACSSPPAPRTYTLQGQVLAVAPDHQQATIKHEEIKDFMGAMTMSYTMKDPKQLDGIVPGDLINATLVVETNGAFVTDVKKVGEAPLEQATPAPSASSGFELLKPGEPVPDGEFVDQNGAKRMFSAFKGSPLALTFMYTKCPLPDFCPLMDRNFAAVQRTLETDPALKNVHLVSISFDPATDTPAVLKKHAAALKADPARWTFLTGDRDERRSVRVPVRDDDHPGRGRSRQHHAQPADRHRRRGGQAGQGVYGPGLEAGPGGRRSEGAEIKGTGVIFPETCPFFSGVFWPHLRPTLATLVS